MNLKLTGISDEAGSTIDEQIRAHQKLGWSHLELRKVEGEFVSAFAKERCRDLAARIRGAGMKVAGLGSPIANGGRKITDPFEKSLEELKVAFRNAEILGTDQIRVMTYANDGLSDEDWQAEAVRRLSVMGRYAGDAGVCLLVENCAGWAGSSPERYDRFFQEVDMPSVRAVYDTGNPASHHQGPAKINEWFSAAKPYIQHVHIKDHTGRSDDVESPTHLWPGEGVCQIRETVESLRSSGYNGFFSIEPHLGIHPDCKDKFETYVKYGECLESLLSP